MPHMAGFDGEFVRDTLPRFRFLSKVDAPCAFLMLRKQCRPASNNCRALSHTRLKINGSHMLNHRSARLLWAKAAGDILTTLPGAGVDQPPFCIAALLQPPAQIRRHAWIESAEPLYIPRSTKYFIATPDGKAPFGRCPTDLSVIGDHIKAAIFAHTRKVRTQGRLEMAQNDLSS